MNAFCLPLFWWGELFATESPGVLCFVFVVGCSHSIEAASPRTSPQTLVEWGWTGGWEGIEQGIWPQALFHGLENLFFPFLFLCAEFTLFFPPLNHLYLDLQVFNLIFSPILLKRDSETESWWASGSQLRSNTTLVQINTFYFFPCFQ